MTSTVWSKFYWSDWANEPGLRLCTLGAQGLWMRMLCVAAEADPTGYVLVNGRALTASDLAQLTGAAEPEVSAHISELERNGVFSRDRRDRIYSRRMVRDARRRARARENGKLGGNPSLRKDEEKVESDNLPLKAQDNTQEPYARSQEPERKKVGGADAPDPGNVIPIKTYAFQGAIIRLKQADFDRWKRTYWAIPDFVAALETADAYYAQNPPKDGKWFFQVSRWLQREHEEALKRRQRRAPDV